MVLIEACFRDIYQITNGLEIETEYILCLDDVEKLYVIIAPANELFYLSGLDLINSRTASC